MTRVLQPLLIDAAAPAAALPALEEAIAGQRALLPVPLQDPARTALLKDSQGAGQAIAEDIAVVVGTSGSTGTPKGAQLTPLNLVASADATHQFLGGEGQWVLAMPAHHIAGLQVLVRSLVAGWDPICVDLSTGFHIGGFARAAAQVRGQAYTALTPLQLAKAMDSLQGIEALRVFDAILIGGAPLNPQLARAAADMQITLVTTYGSSETSGGCVYDGRPLPGAQVRVTQGRIYLGGPMVARGYRNHPGHPAFAEEGWFATSDAGKLIDGRLTVTGRLDAVIDSGGLKLHPEVLEQAMLRIPGVTGACVIGVPHPRLGQAIVAAYSGSASVAEVLDGLDDLPRWQLPKELRQVAALPLVGPGKVDRRGVEKLF
ncbi:2-succinylbenzoate--CoA ligase [Corynebacterium atrinae]|uniref:o-succinylbenzoate--CoA ligase n=1 Tax=Corynebacterium atrinae TaxID=1336740 RepID=UPI0025B2E649|nr:o-succinylbenzoate--CoA ligase [Corynebacterium atrinae]WJY62456.1 2-succinylbenzoate--CoA ligase [Corynebacterium atrinae]